MSIFSKYYENLFYEIVIFSSPVDVVLTLYV